MARSGALQHNRKPTGQQQKAMNSCLQLEFFGFKDVLHDTADEDSEYRVFGPYA